jgi:hypothetical protein
MQALRNAAFLARLVLAWFALSLGVAAASPVVNPQAMELICSGGAVKVLVKTADGVKEMSGHSLDCPVCLAVSTPPPTPLLDAQPAQPLSYALRTIPAAHIAWLTAAPPPGRGPPAHA